MAREGVIDYSNTIILELHTYTLFDSVFFGGRWLGPEKNIHLAMHWSALTSNKLHVPSLEPVTKALPLARNLTLSTSVAVLSCTWIV